MGYTPSQTQKRRCDFVNDLRPAPFTLQKVYNSLDKTYRMRLCVWFADQSSDPGDVALVFALVAPIHWVLVTLFWSAVAKLHGYTPLDIPSPLPEATTAFQALLGIVGFGLAVSAVARLHWRV